ncbi:tetratricopeptide repeat protein [Polycladidibacter stylochi]|uniref:tetratricopeptide repeat protein n=1 Tax=Polycladidibacter stylochi TaxID=1807766 RepID=UPI00082BA579|nr:tetratricopeptide repeat protein [Pseudovibrio stylochi]
MQGIRLLAISIASIAMTHLSFAAPIVPPTPKSRPVLTAPKQVQKQKDHRGLLLSPLSILPPYKASEADKNKNADFAYGAFQRGWYLTALALATRQAEAGQPTAQTLIGVIYETGRGVPQDITKAVDWYELAVSTGEPQAALRLAMLYLDGSQIKQNKQKAAKYLQIAADAKIPSALYNLSILYEEGDTLPKNIDKARKLMEQAAEAGDVDAMYALGQDFVEGPEDKRNYRRGAFWFGRAARRGNIAAQVQYAIMLFKGEGVVPDEKKAADWFERAARAGNPIAMNRLAHIYLKGRGRPINIIEATAWQTHANSLGIMDSELEEVAKSLSLAEQEQAGKRAAQLAKLLARTARVAN